MNKKRALGIWTLVIGVVLMTTLACSVTDRITPSKSTPAPTSKPLTLPSTWTPTSTVVVASTATPPQTLKPTSTHEPTLTPILPSPSPIQTSQPLSKLQLNLKDGDVFRVRMLAEQEIEQDMSGTNMSIDQSIGIEYTYTVTSVNSEGYIWADVVYTWIKYEVRSLMGSFIYDSSNPPDFIRPEVAYYHALVGKGFSLLMSPENKIEKVEGIEELFDSILDEIDLLDPETRELTEQLLKSSFSEESIKEECGGILLEVPEGEINAGDSWNVVLESNLLIPITVEATYTLRTFDGEVAVFDVFSTITSSDEGKMDFMGMELRYELSGTQQGFIEVDTETGLTQISEITQDLSGESVATYEGEEMRIPMTIKSLVTITVVSE